SGWRERPSHPPRTARGAPRAEGRQARPASGASRAASRAPRPGLTATVDCCSNERAPPGDRRRPFICPRSVPMKIATWNINGVKARIENLVAWLKESQPDIVCLQEIKTVDEGFPRAEIEALGYHVETHGQKGFNGVALLSKLRFDEVNRGLPGDDADEQARFIEGVFSVTDTKGTPKALRVVSLYLPNGNPVGTEKFTYKLAWMARLERWASERLVLEEPLVLAGDYNVIPTPIDA